MKGSKKIFGLKELIYPLTTKEFLKYHWLSNQWAHIKGDIKRFDKYSIISKLLSIDDFASKYKSRVSLIHKKEPAMDVDTGKHINIYLKKGYTIYFRDVEDYFPEIKKVLDKLAIDLGMPKMTSEIFVSSGISGVGMHSDYHLNLNLLLSGKKEWIFAKNNSLVNQTSICLPKGKKQVDSTQLKYIKGKLDSRMPVNANQATQYPGEVMFVPRGWWHSTTSQGECISINFIFKNPTLARIFSSSLETDLLNDPEWRNFPYFLDSKNVFERKAAVGQFITLVDKYKKSILKQSSDKIVKKYLESYKL